MGARVLITGLRGFTGVYLARELAACGYEVLGLASDLRNAAAVKEEVQELRPDYAVHLAGISFVPSGDGVDVYAVNTLGAQALLDGLAHLPKPPRRVVLASTSNVYGQREGQISEAECPAPVNHYGCSKLCMERIAATYSDRISISVARPFNYTGVGQSDLFLVPKIVNHFREEKRVLELGNINVSRDFSDVRWVVRAYRALLEHPEAGTYNLCSGRATSIAEIIHLLEQISGHRVEVRTNPAFVRNSDIVTQSGNPARLRKVFDAPSTPMEQLLEWMFFAPSEPGAGALQQ